MLHACMASAGDTRCPAADRDRIEQQCQKLAKTTFLVKLTVPSRVLPRRNLTQAHTRNGAHMSMQASQVTRQSSSAFETFYA
jgi:hypothetical protein